MRIILDTNVLIDGNSDSYSPGAQLIDAVLEGDIEAISSRQVEREYSKIVRRLIDNIEWQDKLNRFLQQVSNVEPKPVEVVIDDQEDQKFIEAAVGGRADFIVTSDRHLLDIGEVGDVKIVTPNEAWQHHQEQAKVGGVSAEWSQWLKGLGITLLVLSLLPLSSLAQDDAVGETKVEVDTSAQQVAAKKQEIAELNKRIEELRGKRDSSAAEAELIDKQLEAITAQLDTAQLEFRRTQSSLKLVNDEHDETQEEIIAIEERLIEKRRQLAEMIRTLYLKERVSIVNVWLTSGSWGDFVNEQRSLQQLQEASQSLMEEMKKQQEILEREEVELSSQQDELSSLGQLLAAQEAELSLQESQQADFLAAKKEEQARFDQKLALAKAARKEIEQDVFSLQGAGVKLQLTDAKDIARYASSLTGVRPALLMAMLKVESGLGSNVGSGTFPGDMHPKSREPFIRVTAKLGLDPNTAPISRAVSYGWGGAMGPGQIMPQTWEGIEARVAGLLGKELANPYELTDAFVATAMMLADRGGNTPAGENEAVGRYLAGPNWRSHPWYVERVQAIAVEYEKEF